MELKNKSEKKTDLSLTEERISLAIDGLKTTLELETNLDIMSIDRINYTIDFLNSLEKSIQSYHTIRNFLVLIINDLDNKSSELNKLTNKLDNDLFNIG